MHTVEMMVMSGVVRLADYKPPRPARSIKVRQQPRDSSGTVEPVISQTGQYLVARIADLFSRETMKGIWRLHR